MPRKRAHDENEFFQMLNPSNVCYLHAQSIESIIFKIDMRFIYLYTSETSP